MAENKKRARVVPFAVQQPGARGAGPVNTPTPPFPVSDGSHPRPDWLRYVSYWISK